MTQHRSRRWRLVLLLGFSLLALQACQLDGPLGQSPAPPTPVGAVLVAQPAPAQARPSPLRILTTQAPAGESGSPFRWGLRAQGAYGEARWSLQGSLPEGLHLQGGAIQGTPNQTGAFSLTLIATDDMNRQARAALQLLISPGPHDGTPDVELVAEAHHSMVGFSVKGVGDVTGDDIPDVLIGAPEMWLEGSPGRAYLVRGPMNTNRKILDDATLLEGVYSGSGAGFAVQGIGDFNGDGHRDLAISAPLGHPQNQGGTVFVVFGPVTGDLNLRQAQLRLEGEQAGDRAGLSLSAPGDVDGDGYDDLLVGAPGSDRGGQDAGAVYLVRGGPREGSLHLSRADMIWEGVAAFEQAGFSLASLGDMDGDGLEEFAVGLEPRPGLQEQRGTSSVAAYLLPLNQPGLRVRSMAEARLTILRETSAEGKGYDVASAGDVNGDGYPELLVGGALEDTGRRVRAACLFLGGPEPRDAIKLGDAHAHLFTRNDGGKLSVASAGDLNGDGLADILVGDAYSDSLAPDAGAVRIFYGPVQGAHSLREADITTLGRQASGFMGFALDGPGDLNGDGLDDVLLGAPQSLSPGAAFVVYGRDR